jgi:hypothetical protein
MFSISNFLVANQILKNGMFSDNTAKHFSQRGNKYNYRPFYDEISKYSRSILANISSTKQ